MIINKSILFSVGILMFLYACKENKSEDKSVLVEDIKIPIPKMVRFGINFSDYHVHEKEIQKGEFLSTLFNEYQTSVSKNELIDSVTHYIKPRDLKIRNDYYLLTKKDNPKALQYFIYEKNAIEYVIVELKDNVTVRTYKKPITVREEIISENITGSLSKTLSKNGLGRDAVEELSNIYKWSINFFNLKREDEFAMIYDERFVDDTISVGMDYLKAIRFKHKGKDFYAFARKNEQDEVEYFNENGNQLKAMFLKAPLKFFRISSKYNLNRFHPVQKRVKPHLGTDYAAPHGTPILATASGTITRIGYGGGNGNFIKIKHNATYSTQYLHMSRFRAGLKQGSYVNQGDVIGYVGSTGLATGPHVCYRFWKNDVQVDPLKLDLPNQDPLTNEEKKEFLEQIKPMKIKLDGKEETAEDHKTS